MSDKNEKQPEYTVTRENGTLWVNGKHNCLGRFTPRGFEVYRNMGAPVEVIGTTSTLEVQNKVTDERSWNSFVRFMQSHHKIDLSKEEYPGAESGKEG